MSDETTRSVDGGAAGSPVGGPAPAGLASHAPAGVGGETIHYSPEQLKAARSVLANLAALRRVVRLYPLEHPVVADAVAQLGNAIRPYHDENLDIQLAFFEGEILLGSQVLAEESMLFDQLDREIRALGIGSIILYAGISPAQLTRMAAILIAEWSDVEAAGGVRAMATEANLTHVQFADVTAVPKDMDLEAAEETAESPREAINAALALLRDTDLLLQGNRRVSAARVNGVVRALVDNVLANRYAMLQLTALRNYDEYTFFHSTNVAIISLALGACVSDNHRFLSSLGVGALLHDIGKLTIDPSVLNKPGPLNPDEWARVRQHPISGAEIVSQLPGLDKSAIVTILEHHIRWDGTGYPARIPRRPQHLCSRIVAIADAYDAMTSRRSYSAARVEDDAMLNIAQGSNTAFDPELVRLFVRMMGVYPPRSVVRLSSGEAAIVLAAGVDDPARPTVRVITDPAGEFVAAEDIVLEDTPGASIVACLDPQLLNIDVDDYL